VDNPKIKADLQWAVEGTDRYVPTPPTKRPAASAPGAKKAAGKSWRGNRALQ